MPDITPAPSTLAGRVLAMAQQVNGQPFAEWPAWSTGECLAVALVLDAADALDGLGFTALQAVDRVTFEVPLEKLLGLQRLVTG